MTNEEASAGGIKEEASDEPTAPPKEMTRGQQTAWVVAAILGAVIAYFLYDAAVNPNLDGLQPYDRCQYWSYYKNHGGSVNQCRQNEAMAAAQRISGQDNDVLSPDEMNATDPRTLDVAPTKF